MKTRVFEQIASEDIAVINSAASQRGRRVTQALRIYIRRRAAAADDHHQRARGCGLRRQRSRAGFYLQGDRGV